MKRIISLIILTVCQHSFSQDKTPVIGKVRSDSAPIENVDVINLKTKIGTITDKNGHFSIDAKPTDTLVFHAQKYEMQRAVVRELTIESGFVLIILDPKPIELNEVIVENGTRFSMPFDQAASDQTKKEMEEARVKNPAIYDGAIRDGVDFIRLGKDAAKFLKKVFKGDEIPPMAQNKRLNFREFVRVNITPSFFLNTLKLKPENVPVFIDYCEVDSKSNQPQNVFEMIEFLTLKNTEFKVLYKN